MNQATTVPEYLYDKQCHECLSMNVFVSEVGTGLDKEGKKWGYTKYVCRDCGEEWEDQKKLFSDEE